MDTLMNWRHGRCSNSPYSFHATAIIKDLSKKIIGARFKCKISNAIVDVPLETIQKALLIATPPHDDKEMCEKYLNEDYYGDSIFSPWDTNICTISLRGADKDNLLPSIYFKDGFVPVVDDDLEGYTSFLFPKMVIRLYDISKSTKNNLNTINAVLYGTDFLNRFGIAEVNKIYLADNLDVRCEMRSYKLEDSTFVENFDSLAKEFCKEVHLHPDALFLSKADKKTITIALPSTACYNTTAPVQTFPAFEDAKSNPALGCIGLVKEFKFQNVVYPLPSEEMRKLYGIQLPKKTVGLTEFYDQNAALVGMKAESCGLLKRYFQVNDNTFVVLLGYVPSIKNEDVHKYLSSVDSGIFCEENTELLDDCLKVAHPAAVKVEYSGMLGKSICISRTLEISEDAFGEVNKKELKEALADNFVKAMNVLRKRGVCTIGVNELLFQIKDLQVVN